jgi:D-alanine-D-alanine ligase
MSAAHIVRTADADRFDVLPIGITQEGRWIDSSEAARALEGTSAALPSPTAGAGDDVDPLPMLAAGPESSQTVVFPLLHGPMGEDGTVQGLLELAGVPYIGAGVLASALCMDKAVSKEVLAHHGLPLARWRSLRRDGARPESLEEVAADLGYPLFVKPANMGSSVGVSKVAGPTDLQAAASSALEYDETIVIEEGIEGREIEVAVLGNEVPDVSVPGEILPSHDFYDFSDKYGGAGARLMVPAELSESEVKEVQDLARRAFRCLRVEGMARADFFYEEGGRGFLVNEVNTIPGFTPFSMYPKLWAATGISYDQLIERLANLAVERWTARSKLNRTRDIAERA